MSTSKNAAVLVESSKDPFKYRCIHCGLYVSDLFKDFGNGAIKLTDCSGCGQVADLYVEVDTMYLMLDFFLQREMVYRHFLFNAQSSLLDQSRFSTSRLLIGLILFDSYSRRILAESHTSVPETTLHYVVISTLFCSTVNIGAYLGTLTFLSSRLYHQNYQTVFHGVLLSMFGVLFNILLLTWATDLRFRFSIQALVYFSNLIALKVISNHDGYWHPFLLICISAIVRYTCVGITCTFFSKDSLTHSDYFP